MPYERLRRWTHSLGTGLDAPLVWAAGEGWHPGVVGIVASRLKEAAKHGFRRAIVPRGNMPKQAPPRMEVVIKVPAGKGKTTIAELSKVPAEERITYQRPGLSAKIIADKNPKKWSRYKRVTTAILCTWEQPNGWHRLRDVDDLQD